MTSFGKIMIKINRFTLLIYLFLLIYCGLFDKSLNRYFVIILNLHFLILNVVNLIFLIFNIENFRLKRFFIIDGSYMKFFKYIYVVNYWMLFQFFLIANVLDKCLTNSKLGDILYYQLFIYFLYFVKISLKKPKIEVDM